MSLDSSSYQLEIPLQAPRTVSTALLPAFSLQLALSVLWKHRSQKKAQIKRFKSNLSWHAFGQAGVREQNKVRRSSCLPYSTKAWGAARPSAHLQVCAFYKSRCFLWGLWRIQEHPGMGNGAWGTRGIGGRARNKAHTSQLQVLLSMAWSQEKKEVSTPDPACIPNSLGISSGNVPQGLRSINRLSCQHISGTTLIP